MGAALAYDAVLPGRYLGAATGASPSPAVDRRDPAPEFVRTKPRPQVRRKGRRPPREDAVARRRAPARYHGSRQPAAIATHTRTDAAATVTHPAGDSAALPPPHPSTIASAAGITARPHEFGNPPRFAQD
jgi:hypothetical protein